MSFPVEYKGSTHVLVEYGVEVSTFWLSTSGSLYVLVEYGWKYVRSGRARVEVCTFW